MATKKKRSKKTESSKTTVNFSLSFSKTTASKVNDITDSSYRGNRSMAVESMVVKSPEYKGFRGKPTRKK